MNDTETNSTHHSSFVTEPRLSAIGDGLGHGNSINQMIPSGLNRSLVDPEPAHPNQFSSFLSETPNFSCDGLVMARVMEDIEKEKHRNNYVDLLLKQFDEMSAAEKHMLDDITEVDDEKEKEVLMLEKRLSVLKRECNMLKTENQQLWKLFNNFI